MVAPGFGLKAAVTGRSWLAVNGYPVSELAFISDKFAFIFFGIIPFVMPLTVD
jgi:hypothetical protein